MRSTEVYQFDLLDCPAVAQLRGDPQQGPVYELLSIMLSGDVQASNNLAYFTYQRPCTLLKQSTRAGVAK